MRSLRIRGAPRALLVAGLLSMVAAASEAAQRTTATPPIISLRADPNSVAAGGSSLVSWATADAQRCKASGGWSGRKPTQGTYATGSLKATQTYGLQCVGPGGTTSAEATVQVGPPSPPAPGTPSVSLTANPPGVPRNTTTTLSWTSANVTSCAASGGWSGTKALIASESVGPISQDTTYTLSCTGTGGNAVAMTTVSLREAVLTWQAATKNVDGSTLTNLSGFKIYYGTASRNYTQTVRVSGASTTTWTLSLAPGTYYFAVTAVNSTGAESAKTNEISKTVN